MHQKTAIGTSDMCSMAAVPYTSAVDLVGLWGHKAQLGHMAVLGTLGGTRGGHMGPMSWGTHRATWGTHGDT